MADGKRLDCGACPGFCCKMAGYVEISRSDTRRLAQHLDLTVPEFEKRHTKKPRGGGRRRIKEADDTCQFLGPDHRCTVYKARPTDCRGYICWDQDDKTVYEFAAMTQLPIKSVRKWEKRIREPD